MEPVQVGQYILEEKLGQGGMAEVWKARNVVLGNYAAVKFLVPQLAGIPDIEQRFLTEGKRQANLHHPNIVSAFDFLYVEGRSYLVMHYIKGESLEDRLCRLNNPMPLQAVLSISNDVLGALDYAHSEGVVHRDIKPSNILLESSGRAQVLDFGIAVVMGEQRVTRAGVSIGTPHYMSPEQIVGTRDFDHRTDIYSYGCVLYEMLTQRPPFDAEESEGDTEFFVKSQHVNRPPRPLRELNPEVPEYVEIAVLRCLAKNPADRFASCRDLQEALSHPPVSRRSTMMEAAFPAAPELRRTQLDIPAQAPAPLQAAALTSSFATSGAQAPPPIVPAPPPVPPRKSNVLWIAVALLAILSILGGGVYWFTRPKPTSLAENQPKQETPVPAPIVQPPVAVPPPSVPSAKSPEPKPKPKLEKPPVQNAPVYKEPVPEPAPVKVAPQPATSGVLNWTGNPVPPGGQVVFYDLPKERLKFEWDRNVWKLFLRNGPGGRKDLVLTSLSPVTQTNCVVRYRLNE